MVTYKCPFPSRTNLNCPTTGFAERAENEAPLGSTNYIPHHGIYHSKKNKLRIVFDCSANYFWHSAQTCERDPEKLAGTLAVVLHHIINEHEWLFRIDGRPSRCEHGPLDEATTPWLTSGSPTHEKLRDIIMNKTLLEVHAILQ